MSLCCRIEVLVYLKEGFKCLDCEEECIDMAKVPNARLMATSLRR